MTFLQPSAIATCRGGGSKGSGPPLPSIKCNTLFFFKQLSIKPKNNNKNKDRKKIAQAIRLEYYEQILASVLDLLNVLALGLNTSCHLDPS